MILEKYQMLLPKVEKHLLVAKSQKKMLIDQKDKLVKVINDLKSESQLILSEKEFIKEVCEKGRIESAKFLENLVTNSIQYILGDEYSVSIHFDERGSTPTAEILVRTSIGGYEVDVDPANEDGGGIADIVALVFQALYIVLTTPNSKTPIFLDEPTKFVSKGIYAENTANFLCELSQVYEKQIVMVTHDDSLASIADLSYTVTIDDNGSSLVTKTY